ncbi:GAF domain-containing protein [Nocardia sp. NPDC050710]|uniref:GAF domain-containing protein n=1 Tax=Nocardia sp. NPDC050710 TaxID=3157220 RepID=UPI0033D816A5
MPGYDWLLIETLRASEEPTLVADGIRLRDWGSPVRARRELGPAAPRHIAEVVRRCREAGVIESHRDAGLVVVGIPVRCAFDEVHGVQVWAGPPTERPPARPAVAAWDWEADTELAYHGPGLEELVFARAPEEVRVVRTPPEAFGAMVRFDGRVEYFEMVGTMDGRYQGDVDMIGDDGRVRNFQMVTRADPRDRRIRALMHLIPDPALVRPDVDMEMMRAVSQHAVEGVGFVGLVSGVIYEWPRVPPPPLHRWAVERPQLHPDDRVVFRAACDELAAVADSDGHVVSRHLRIRVRFADTDWIAVRAELLPMAKESGHGILRVSPAT